MTDLVLLDYDGVIVDSAQPVLEQTAVFCKDQGLPFSLTLADFDQLDPATFAMLAKVAGIPDSDHRAYGRFLFDTLQNGVTQIALFDGISEMLRDLSERHILCVVTANHADVVRTRLAQEGLNDCIGTYYGSDRPGGKAEHIREAFNHYAIDARQTWMVGDSVSDMDAARTAGVNALAVAWGWQSADVLKTRAPDHLFNAPQELHAFLSCLLALSQTSHS
jgi:phosphoglycolate phosphatase